ncbi:MAG: sigma-70 family RNA polymerase sigma factor [Verrucomicrobiae bacterium]|nr:sigma-70 family RNA polymerase sigma factor [Verrucomicrobiae bacterium]
MQDNGEGTSADSAWEKLARAYWKPLYVFLRRKELDHDTAADAIQGFFAHLLSREFLRKIERGNGLFRSFLLTSLQNWRTDQHRAATAQKRSQGSPVIPLHEIEEIISAPNGTSDSPEEAFDRRWARTLYDNALEKLHKRLTNRGREAHFLKLLGLFNGDGTEPYAKIAADLGMTEGAVQQAALELRREFGNVLRQEIGATVTDESQVDGEIRYLLGLLRGS